MKMRKILVTLTLLAFTAVFAVSCAADDSPISSVVTVTLSIIPYDQPINGAYSDNVTADVKYFAPSDSVSYQILNASGIYTSTAGGPTATHTISGNTVSVLCKDPGTGYSVTFKFESAGFSSTSIWAPAYYKAYGLLVTKYINDITSNGTDPDAPLLNYTDLRNDNIPLFL